MKNLLLQKEQTGIVMIDAQEKLMSVMGQRDATLNNMVKLIHLAKWFELPVLLTEQMPQNIGKTLDEVTQMTKDDIFEMIGIPLTINRVKCALLSLKTLIIGTQGIAEWQKVEDKDED